APPAHAARDPVLRQPPLVVLAGVLAAAVRMRHQPRPGPPPGHGHRQGIDDQAAGDPLAHRPADDLPRVQVLHGCRGQPALPGRDGGDIRDPGPVRRRRLELPVEHVRGRRAVRVGVRRVPELPPGFRGDPVGPHQFRHRVQAAGPATRGEFGVHPRAAVPPLDLLVDGLEFDHQGIPTPLPGAGGALPPGVVAAGRNLQSVAQQPYRPPAAVLVDEAVPHSDSLAKKAVAFFKMSRSISSRWFSPRRRRSSSSRAGRSPRPGEARPPSAWRARRQLRSRFSRMPRLRAASATERPSSVTSLTASALNSRVYVRRVCPMLDLLTKSLRSYLSAHHPWGSPSTALTTSGRAFLSTLVAASIDLPLTPTALPAWSRALPGSGIGCGKFA